VKQKTINAEKSEIYDFFVFRDDHPAFATLRTGRP
jgi:hypothetical protein